MAQGHGEGDEVGGLDEDPPSHDDCALVANLRVVVDVAYFVHHEHKRKQECKVDHVNTELIHQLHRGEVRVIEEPETAVPDRLQRVEVAQTNATARNRNNRVNPGEETTENTQGCERRDNFEDLQEHVVLLKLAHLTQVVSVSLLIRSCLLASSEADTVLARRIIHKATKAFLHICLRVFFKARSTLLKLDIRRKLVNSIEFLSVLRLAQILLVKTKDLVDPPHTDEVNNHEAQLGHHRVKDPDITLERPQVPGFFVELRHHHCVGQHAHPNEQVAEDDYFGGASAERHLTPVVGDVADSRTNEQCVADSEGKWHVQVSVENKVVVRFKVGN